MNISIHALHEESDMQARGDEPRRTGISIHALHEESDSTSLLYSSISFISIHALHEESDRIPRHGLRTGRDFNPRSP